MSKSILEIRDLIKTYDLYPNNKEKLKSLFKKTSQKNKFYALNGINLTINSGESVGVVGLNGSGKSTLSNIIAGLSPETFGEVRVNGTVSLLSIASGLNNDLTGRENIELKCLMLGLSREKIKEIEPEIIEFSELGEYIDQPVKNYSSGMKSRLGFSISSSLNPDVFIVDEALSVGDPAFTEKSIDKMMSFKENGKSIIYISHSLSQIRQFCDKVLWIEAGRIKAYGNTEEVLKYFNSFMKYWKTLSSSEKERYKKIAYNVPINKVVDNEKMYLYSLGVDDFNWINNSEKLRQFYISKVVRFKNESAKVYKNIKNEKEFIRSDNLVDITFYAKKSTHYRGEIYFLLSNEESYQFNLIGWVNIKDLEYHDLTLISTSHARVLIKGSGVVYTKAWGAKKDLLSLDLSSYKNKEMIVDKSYTVANKFLWYYGKIDGESFWISMNHTAPKKSVKVKVI